MATRNTAALKPRADLRLFPSHRCSGFTMQTVPLARELLAGLLKPDLPWGQAPPWGRGSRTSRRRGGPIAGARASSSTPEARAGRRVTTAVSGLREAFEEDHNHRRPLDGPEGLLSDSRGPRDTCGPAGAENRASVRQGCPALEFERDGIRDRHAPTTERAVSIDWRVAR